MATFIKEGISLSLSAALDNFDGYGVDDCELRSCGVKADEQLRDGLFVCLDRDPELAIRNVKTAAQNGAVVAVLDRACSEGVASALDGVLTTIFCDNPRVVYGRACQALRGNPGRKMRLVAVTGSAGKTSLSYVLGGVLAEAGMRVGLIGSLGIYDGKRLAPTRETTPDPEKLASVLETMVENGCVCAIIELSSVALAEDRPAGLAFDAACLTNIRRDHLDYHGSVEAYRNAKLHVFDYLKLDGIAICNVDDRVTDAAIHLIEQPVLTVGIQPTTCSVSGTPVERQKGEQTFYVVAGTDAAPVRTKVIGKEHIYNCLEAAALAIAWDVDLVTIARGIERVEYIPGRMEQVECGQSFGVYLDRASAPHSLAAALEALRAVTHGLVYCVLCPPNDKDRGKRQLLAVAAEAGADVTVVTSGNLPESQTDEALEDLRRGFTSKNSFHDEPNRKRAIEWALTQATIDDSVLIVGQDVSSLDPVNELFVPDRQFVKNWLCDNLPSSESYWFN